MKSLAVLFLLILCSDTCFAQETQAVFATGEWLPLTSETLPEYGAATAIVSAACDAAGIRPTYGFYPWKRAEMMVREGDAAAGFPFVLTDQREAYADPSDPLFYGVMVFVYYTRNPRTSAQLPYEELADLQGFRIGGLRGSFFEKDLNRAGIEYDATTTTEQSIQKLAAGRIDLYLENSVVAYDTIRRLYPDEVESFKMLAKPFGKKIPNVLLVSKKHPESRELLIKFNDGLRIIKENGEYGRLIEKYHMIQ